jgi:hypothetical protein
MSYSLWTDIYMQMEADRNGSCCYVHFAICHELVEKNDTDISTGTFNA